MNIWSDDIEKAAADCSYGDDHADLTGMLTDLTLAKSRLETYAKCNPMRDLKMAIAGLDDVISDVTAEREYAGEKLHEYAAHLKCAGRI